MLKNILIFGDSYSTYEGYIPEGFATYYSPQGRPNTAVCKMSVDDTWWKRLMNQTGATLVQNNSWSGSTLGHTGYAGDCSQTNSFIYRYRQLRQKGFFDDKQVDTIFVFGGTNDSWAGAPLGELKFSDWEEQDLFQVLPAFCYFMDTVKKDFPKAEIRFIINCDIKPEIMEGARLAGEQLGINVVQLKDIDKDSGHPTIKGMSQICEQVLKSFE